MPDWLNIDNTVLQALLIAIGIALITLLLVRLGQRLVARYIDDPERRYRANKFIGRTGGLIGLMAILLALVRSVNLLAILTVVGAGLAISLRETLISMAGWLYITFRVPYRPGDRIEANGVRGDVIDIRILHTTMMEIGGWVAADQSTGRIVHVPNSTVFLHQVFNYTKGFHFIWNELPLTVTFRSDWQAARALILSMAEESAAIIEQQAKNEIQNISREYFIYYNILTPFVYVRIVDNGVLLTLRYLCEARKRRGTEHALTISILAAFKDHGGIELAYPMMGLARLDGPQFGPPPA